MKPGIIAVAIDAALVLLPLNAFIRFSVLPCPIWMKPMMMMRAKAVNLTNNRRLRAFAVHFTVTQFTVAQLSVGFIIISQVFCAGTGLRNHKYIM